MEGDPFRNHYTKSHIMKTKGSIGRKKNFTHVLALWNQVKIGWNYVWNLCFTSLFKVVHFFFSFAAGANGPLLAHWCCSNKELHLLSLSDLSHARQIHSATPLCHNTRKHGAKIHWDGWAQSRVSQHNTGPHWVKLVMKLVLDKAAAAEM